MMENLLEMEMNIDLIRESQEYGCTCVCPYSFYAAIEYGYIEDQN